MTKEDYDYNKFSGDSCASPEEPHKTKTGSLIDCQDELAWRSLGQHRDSPPVNIEFLTIVNCLKRGSYQIINVVAVNQPTSKQSSQTSDLQRILPRQLQNPVVGAFP